MFDSTIGTSFLVIVLAEFGDKSQLVCMTLAARFRGLPVFLGATTAFGLLNGLAVIFGAALVAWIPKNYLIIGVSLLFASFGFQSLRTARGHDGSEEHEPPPSQTDRNIFLTAFLMIFLAELGDKTQIATAGLAVTASPFPVWIGATLGEAFTNMLAIVVGQKLLQRVPIKTVQKVSGLFFLLLAGVAMMHLFQNG